MIGKKAWTVWLRTLRSFAQRSALARVALVVALITVPSACLNSYEELPSYRYRLMVEVSTPEGLKRGSSVIEVRTWQGGANNLDGGGAIRRRINGEAATIDLGRRGTVFALMRAGNSMDWPGEAATTLTSINRRDPHVSPRQEIDAIKALKGVRDVPRTFLSATVPFKNWPDFVRFADPKRTETIAWVDPSMFPLFFGTGVSVQRVTIEIVDASVTRTIEQRLPWLNTPSGEARIPLNLKPRGEEQFIPPLSGFDFRRTED